MGHVRKLFNPRLFLLMLMGILVACAVLNVSEARGEEPALNIPRMIQESPYFTDHPGSTGIMWLKDAQYSLGADGSMTRTTTRVILARRGIPDRWTRWNFPIPDGGSVEVLSASLYDPGSGRIISPVLPRNAESGGIPFVEVLFPDIREEFIIVLLVKEVFPKRFALEDFLWVNEEIPQWELRVTVDVPGGLELQTASTGAGDVRTEKAGLGRRFSWRVINSPGWDGRTLKSDARDFISFSTRKGTEPLARGLSAYDSVLVPNPPAEVQSVINRGSSIKTGRSLIQWMNETPDFPVDVPSSFVRSDIPSEGPWTGWEKVLLLNKWIRKAGWESRLHWLAAYPLDKGYPAVESAVVRPILELNFKGISPFYCDVGRGNSPVETPPFLWGKPVYTLSETGLSGGVIAGSSAAEHRLSIEWTLSLESNGALSGKADVFIRNGWAGFFFPGGTPGENSLQRIASELFPGLRYAPDTGTVSPIKYGWKVTLPAETGQAIVNAGAMLVPFPSVRPSWLEELDRFSGEYRMSFPFVVEQKFTIKLPPKTEIVMMPSTFKRSLDKVRYEESVYHNKRRNTISIEAKIVLSVDAITDSVGRSLSESVRRWMDFAGRSLPLRVK